ncbi:MAG: MFS transporter [Anaerolineae bacterium]|nr:MFS transporter [Anaerolineae bacterium]
MTPLKTFIRDPFTWMAYSMLAYYAYFMAILGPLMPFLRSELNLNYTVTGLHLSAFAVGMIGAGLLTDRLTGRWGRRPVFWVGGLGMALGAVGLTVSGQSFWSITSILAMGLLGTLMLALIQTTLSDHHGEQRVIALTESNVGASISASLAPVFVGNFERIGLGWRLALLLGVVAFVWLTLRFRRQLLPERQRGSSHSRAGSRPLPLVFWAYWFVICISVSVEWCLIFWGADFLEKVVGLSQVNAATMMSIFFGAMVVGRFVGSRLTRILSGATLLLLAIGITLVGFPLFWLARFAPLNLAGLFIAGLGVANLFPLTLSVALNVVPTQADVASPRLSLGGGTAILLAPLILGWTADQLNIQNAYGIVALLAIIAAAVTFWANRMATSHDKVLADENPVTCSE